MLLINELHKLRNRTRVERGLIVEALFCLGLMRAALLLLPFWRIAGIMGLAQCGAGVMSESLSTDKAASVGWALRSAASRTPWASTCLVQALAGILMLRARNIPGIICLGVSKDSSDPEPLSAHAWLHSGKVILTGADGHEQFVAISAFVWSPKS